MKIRSKDNFSKIVFFSAGLNTHDKKNYKIIKNKKKARGIQNENARKNLKMKLCDKYDIREAKGDF
jgi:hypothetical protein